MDQWNDEFIQEVRGLYEDLLDIADEALSALGPVEGGPASFDPDALERANARLRHVSRLILATQDEAVRE